MSEITVELAPFQLMAGTSEEDLHAASEAMQTQFLERQDGFIRRELLRADATHWCDLVHWSSPDAAKRAMENAMNSPVCFAYFHLMVSTDGVPETNVQHFAVRAAYGAGSSEVAQYARPRRS